jgi:hypothetical protein
MSETMIVALEDVLIQGERALDRHVLMYTALCTQYRSVILSTLDRDEGKRIMKLNRIRYDIFFTKDDSILTDASWKVSAVRDCLATGWYIGFYLDVDPTVVREVYAMGVSSLLLSHHLLRPAWLPTNGPPRAWEELVQFQDAQRERSTDRSKGRVDEVDGGGRRWSLNEA